MIGDLVDLVLEPGHSLGPVTLGTSFRDVPSLFPKRYPELLQPGKWQNLAWFFADLLLMIRATGNTPESPVDEIQVSRDGGSRVLLFGEPVLGVSIGAVRRTAHEHALSLIRLSDDPAAYDGQGWGLWVPDGTVEAVLCVPDPKP